MPLDAQTYIKIGLLHENNQDRNDEAKGKKMTELFRHLKILMEIDLADEDLQFVLQALKLHSKFDHSLK